MIHGWLNLYKPPHMSSARAVSLVRKALKVKKIGHAGTLDPLAEGVLPLAIGEATKTVNLVMHDEKEYHFEVLWGAATTTDDAEGEVIATSTYRPTSQEILQVISSFVGEIEQVPPAYSALKIDGKRAYDLARQGKDVQLAARKVQIHELSLLEVRGKDRAFFRVRCGKGTYVRSLARDLAERLNAKGHVTELIRTRVGKFLIQDAIFLDNLQELGHKVHTKNYIQPIADVLDDIPAISLNPEQVMKIIKGQAVEYLSGRILGQDATVLCLTSDRQVFAIGHLDKGYIQPKRVFNI